MPEEHTGQLGFEYAWKELLARSRQSGELIHLAINRDCGCNSICHRSLPDVQFGLV
jgi:hypothetical protein